MYSKDRQIELRGFRETLTGQQFILDLESIAPNLAGVK